MHIIPVRAEDVKNGLENEKNATKARRYKEHEEEEDDEDEENKEQRASVGEPQGSGPCSLQPAACPFPIFEIPPLARRFVEARYHKFH